jgi:hypothetical protein
MPLFYRDDLRLASGDTGPAARELFRSPELDVLAEALTGGTAAGYRSGR